MNNYLVTGASRGIGKAIALNLAEKKVILYLTGRDEKALDDTCEKVIAKDSKAIPILADLSDPSQIESLVNKIDCENIQAIIHNAGMGLVEPFEEITLDSWQKVLNVNVTAPFLITKYLSKKLTEGSSIVNILSVASHAGFPNWSSYCMSKFALDGFMKSIREELRERKIRVINIYPGATATDIWKTIPGDFDLDKMMSADRIAEAVCYALDQPDNVLIENITVTNLAGNQ